jgi:hypothetical protein
MESNPRNPLAFCPYCGHEQAANVMLTGGRKLKTQVCLNCGASGPTVLADDQTLAVFERWNQRAERTCQVLDVCAEGWAAGYGQCSNCGEGLSLKATGYCSTCGAHIEEVLSET